MCMLTWPSGVKVEVELERGSMSQTVTVLRLATAARYTRFCTSRNITCTALCLTVQQSLPSPKFVFIEIIYLWCCSLLRKLCIYKALGRLNLSSKGGLQAAFNSSYIQQLPWLESTLRENQSVDAQGIRVACAVQAGKCLATWEMAYGNGQCRNDFQSTRLRW